MEHTENTRFDVNRMIQTAIRVVTAPTPFFQAMPKTGGFGEPLVFAVAFGVLVGVLQFLVGLVGLPLTGMPGLGGGFAALILTPILVAVMSFVGAAVMFVLWKLLGSTETYETAYRCCAYMTAVFPLVFVVNLVPYLGILVGLGVSLYYTVAASVGAHGIPAKKAWTVFGILFALLALLNITGQIAARRLAGEAERMRIQAEETAKAMEKQAEAIRQQAERMEKQAQELQKQTQEETREGARRQMEEAQKALEALQKQVEKMKEGKASP